jgi:hypothetical protein
MIKTTRVKQAATAKTKRIPTRAVRAPTPATRTPKPAAPKAPKPPAPKASKPATTPSAAVGPAAASRTDDRTEALFAAMRRDVPEFVKQLEDEDETTHFITVDLEIGSRGKVDEIAAVLGPRMAEMYRGKIGTLNHANYEGDGGDTIDETIENLLRMLRKLNPAGKREWRAAKVRDFNIGIQAGMKPNSLELTVSDKTMQAVARLGGRLVITVYAYGRGRISSLGLGTPAPLG